MRFYALLSLKKIWHGFGIGNQEGNPFQFHKVEPSEAVILGVAESSEAVNVQTIPSF
jgi:hypothetical protein